jgi:predicted HTH transcriptional regulator
MVLFGRDRDRTVPDEWIQAGRFAGLDRADIIDTARFDGPPLAELEHVMQFIRRHTSTGAQRGSRTLDLRITSGRRCVARCRRLSPSVA